MKIIGAPSLWLRCYDQEVAMAGSRGNRGFDPTVAHPARVYDYWLGGKDNSSQVVPASRYSGPTVNVQKRHTNFSKIESLVMRDLLDTSLGDNVLFVGRGFLMP
jgi:hypothetical protein